MVSYFKEKNRKAKPGILIVVFSAELLFYQESGYYWCVNDRNENSSPFGHLVRDLDQLRALADPFRLRILQGFVEGARTVKDVARAMDDKPSRLYHHVAVLEDAGLLEITSTRKVRGTVEKHYRAVAARFEVDGSLLSSGRSPAHSDTEHTAMVTSLLSQTRTELLASYRRQQDGGGDAGGQKPFLARLLLRGSKEEVEALFGKIQAVVDECAARQATGDCCDSGSQYAMTLAFYRVESDQG